ncbi:hypothetical protein EJB05_32374, partial [Eragrostis curvula]
MGFDIYLPNLLTVTLKRLPQCSSLPPLGLLPNLEYLHIEDMPRITKIDRGIFGDAVKVFTRLKFLTISDMENLEEWSTTYSYGEGAAEEFMFPNLEILTIIRCRKLRLKPCAPRVTDTWKIKDSDSVLLQWEETTGSTTTVDLCADPHRAVAHCRLPTSPPASMAGNGATRSRYDRLQFNNPLNLLLVDPQIQQWYQSQV